MRLRLSINSLTDPRLFGVMRSESGLVFGCWWWGVSLRWIAPPRRVGVKASSGIVH